MLAECESCADTEDWCGVARVFAALMTELHTHIHAENEVLFPAYEALPGAPAAPTAALREEHLQIERLLRDVEHVLASRDSDLFTAALAYLYEAMLRHHENEERIFLPMAGHALLASREAIESRLRVYFGHPA